MIFLFCFSAGVPGLPQCLVCLRNEDNLKNKWNYHIRWKKENWQMLNYHKVRWLINRNETISHSGLAVQILAGGRRNWNVIHDKITGAKKNQCKPMIMRYVMVYQHNNVIIWSSNQLDLFLWRNKTWSQVSNSS